MLAEVLQSEGSHEMEFDGVYQIMFPLCTVLQTGSAQNVGK